EIRGDLLEARDLLREAEDERAPLRIGLLLQPLHHAVVEAPDEELELIGIGGNYAALLARLLGREGHAPDLLALLPAEIVEELDETGDEIRLGEQHVDREADAELGIELLEAGADRLGVRHALRLVCGEQVGEANGDDRTVDRLPLAELL